MKFKKVMGVILAVVTVVAAAPVYVIPEVTVEASGSFYNWHGDAYDFYHADSDDCVTLADSDGTLSLIYSELNDKDQQTMYIKKVSLNGDILSTKSVNIPGNKWGGSVCEDGEGNKYVATASSKEGSIKWYFTKFTPDWTNAGQTTVNGKDTQTARPYSGGCCDMAVDGNYLVAHACQVGTDGHQSNYTFIIDRDSMKRTAIDPADSVAHSFYQAVINDGDKVIEVDLGDAIPRALLLQSYILPDDSYEHHKRLTLIDINGEDGENHTEVTVGGLVAGKNHYLVSGSSIHHENLTDKEFTQKLAEDEKANDKALEKGDVYLLKRDVYLSLAKKNLKSQNLMWLTDYAGEYKDYDTSDVKITDIGNDHFLISYDLTYRASDKSIVHKSCFVEVDSDGNVVDRKTADERFICDSQPVYVGGRVVYVYASADTGKTAISMNVYNPSDGSSDRYYFPPAQKASKATFGKSTGNYKKWDYLSTGGTYVLELYKLMENVPRGYGVGFSVQSSSDPDVLDVEPVSLIDADSYGPEPDENQDNTYLHTFIKVKALKAGTATITGTIGNGTGKITLKVRNEPNKTKIRKGSGKHGKCKLTWSKSLTAEGYELMFSADDSNWKKKIKKRSVKKNVTSSSFKIPDDYCYAKIRAYRTLNGKKVYSKWSSLFVID